MGNRILTFWKKRSTPLLCCAVAVLMLGGAALLSSRAQLSRELERRDALIEREMIFNLHILAARLEDPAESPEFIGGLASSFRNFSQLDSSDGYFFNVGRYLSGLRGQTVQALSAQERAQIAALLRQLVDARDADVETQLDLLLQLDQLT